MNILFTINVQIHAESLMFVKMRDVRNRVAFFFVAFNVRITYASVTLYTLKFQEYKTTDIAIVNCIPYSTE